MTKAISTADTARAIKVDTSKLLGVIQSGAMAGSKVGSKGVAGGKPSVSTRGMAGGKPA